MVFVVAHLTQLTPISTVGRPLKSRTVLNRPRKVFVTPQAALKNGNGAAESSPTGSQPSSGNVKRPALADMRALFSEAQRNISQLNKSRLAALEELDTARRKIAALEERLESAESRTQSHGPGAEQPTLASSTPPTQRQQQQQQQPSKNYSGSSGGGQSSTEPLITLVYESGWQQVFLHYNADNAGWTQSPGMRFEVGRDNYAGKHVVTVRGHSLNFVVTNGNDGWDTPDPYSGGHKNYYVVNEPGIWRLKSGKVGRLNQWQD